MSRLTKNIREDMARKLVAHRYSDEAKEIMYTDRALFDRAYKHRYSDTTLKHIEAVRKEFPNEFCEDSSMIVNAGGYRILLGGEFRSRWVKVESAPRPTVLLVNGSMNHSITDEKLMEDIKTHADKKRAFDRVCETAYHEALAVLNTVTTGKKLAEAWPEAMPVIGDLIPEGDRTLPVVQVADVNKKFKLPPKDKKAA
jgi:hypothetical protein